MTEEKLQISSAAVSDKGLSEKRPQNEDSYLELRDSGLYAVADGVGGAQAGDVASQMAMEILGEAFINLQEDGDAEDRMKAAIQQANSAIFQMSNQLKQLSTMATTIVAVHMSNTIATIGHVGDSRLYRLDSQGNLFRETQDHSVVEEEVRAGRMTPEQAKTHPSRNVISRALGAEQTVEVDMKTISFEPNTKFLVCSDGVTRHISDEEIRSILVSEDDSFIICQTIKSICFDRGAEDNLTAVVVSTGAVLAEALTGSPALIDEFEEDTIATARPPLVEGSLLENSIGETETRFTPQVDEAFELDELVEEEELVIPTKKDLPSKPTTNAETTNSHTSVKRKLESTTDVKSYRVDEGGGIGVLGKILGGIIFLLLGAVLGLMGYHFFLKGQPASNPVSQPVGTTNQVVAAFEENRWEVDSNPERYIANNVNPQTAFDHYLLGRAYILVGNFDSAKKELVKAKAKLPKSDGIRETVLENDISIAMGKIDSGDNKKEGEKATNSNSINKPSPSTEAGEDSAGPVNEN